MSSGPEDDDHRLSEVFRWFAERGFGLGFTTDEDESGDEIYSADLTSVPSGRVLAPRYGRGESRAMAAQSARSRFEVEQ